MCANTSYCGYMPNEKSIKSLLTFDASFCRGDRIRTCDHLVPNQERYRTALHPVLISFKRVQR